MRWPTARSGYCATTRSCGSAPTPRASIKRGSRPAGYGRTCGPSAPRSQPTGPPAYERNLAGSAELGQARDADVLLGRLTDRAAGLPQASADGAKRVIDALATRRTEAHDGVMQALASDRYLDLHDRLIAAAQAPALVEDQRDRAAGKALPPIVRRAWRQLEKKVSSLGKQPADEDLHMVRILAKRCRYAAEACAPTLGKQTHRLAEAAKNLQDVLGELNDAVVAERWLRDWAAHTRSGPGAFAAGELAAMEREAAQQARAQWPAAWKQVKAAAPAN